MMQREFPFSSPSIAILGFLIFVDFEQTRESSET